MSLEELGADDGLLRKGSKGERVREVQRALNAKGYALDADGDYGRKTEAAVRKFQQEGRLKKVDGVVGPETLAALGLSAMQVTFTDEEAGVVTARRPGELMDPYASDGKAAALKAAGAGSTAFATCGAAAASWEQGLAAVVVAGVALATLYVVARLRARKEKVS